MIVDHALEPVMHLKEKSDDIRTYGCIQVNLLFMLRPSSDATQDELVDLVKRMMESSCEVIKQNNDEVRRAHDLS